MRDKELNSLKGFILAWPLVGALGWILYFVTSLPFFQ
jgi:hypothetical protein